MRLFSPRVLRKIAQKHTGLTSQVISERGSKASIEVWTIRTAALAPVLARCHALLSPAEREQVRRFYRDKDRNSYTVSHGALRVLLGQWLGDHAARIEFRNGPMGKPEALGGCGLHFNMSHSDGYTMIAIAQDVAVGIDIENLNAKVDVENIARHFFCRDEVRKLSLLPRERRQLAFFLGWTRKEALIKATGQGLSRGLDTFEVSLHPDEAARLVWSSPEVGGSWMLHNLVAPTGYVAALAYYKSQRIVVQHPLQDAEQILSWNRFE